MTHVGSRNRWFISAILCALILAVTISANLQSQP